MLRGFSAQQSQPNFLHELADLVFTRRARRHGTELHQDPHPGLLFDGRQDFDHQAAGGNVSLLSQSKLYVYRRDRTYCPEEHMLSNGWGMEAISNMEHYITDDVEAQLRAELGDAAESPLDAKRRRKGRAPQYENLVVDLAGNGQSLPDLACFTIPLVYLLKLDYFKQGWHPHELPMIKVDTDVVPRAPIVIDADTQSELQRWHRTHGVTQGSLQPDV